jgi:HPt (histidine-containing phosphotransfer) domain-containing protein
MNNQVDSDQTAFTARVEGWLAEYIPRFLSNRRNDVEEIHRALGRGDFETVKRLGHNLKGVGGGYGFGPISVMGGELESAARQRNTLAAQAICDGLAEYLDRVRVITE